MDWLKKKKADAKSVLERVNTVASLHHHNNNNSNSHNHQPLLHSASLGRNTSQQHLPSATISVSLAFKDSPPPRRNAPPVANVSPFLGKVMGDVKILNPLPHSVTSSRLAIVLLSGQGISSAGLAAAGTTDPEKPNAIDIHARPLARAMVILWQTSTSLSPGMNTYPFTLPFSKQLPPTITAPGTPKGKEITHECFACLNWETAKGHHEKLVERFSVDVKRCSANVQADERRETGDSDDGEESAVFDGGGGVAMRIFCAA
ncbi:hypothetical protein HK104_001381 [Borealophlyctis nickersoniae]|nr:hypothetical protein HK104_001381 [Borealophlyctis nickersoniae]